MKSTQEVIPRTPSQAGTGCWAGKQLKNERWRSSTRQASPWCSPSERGPRLTVTVGSPRGTLKCCSVFGYLLKTAQQMTQSTGLGFEGSLPLLQNKLKVHLTSISKRPAYEILGLGGGGTVHKAFSHPTNSPRQNNDI